MKSYLHFVHHVLIFKKRTKHDRIGFLLGFVGLQKPDLKTDF